MDLSPIIEIRVLGTSTEPPRTTRAVAAPVLAHSNSHAPDPGRVLRLVATINRALDATSRGIEFSIDPDTHQTVIRIRDLQTKEVIRQIPSEEALAIARTIEGFQGVILRDRA